MKKTNKSNLKKYECLLILDTIGKEEAEKEILDRVQKEIQQAGGKVETVQKMGQKPFARNAKGRSAGSYVNIIFGAPGKVLKDLDAKFHLDTELFRWQFSEFVPEPVRKPRREPTEAGKETKPSGRERDRE